MLASRIDSRRGYKTERLLTHVNSTVYICMGRKRHPKQVIEAAIQYAESKGWRFKKAGKSAHAWGRLLCPEASSEGCQMSIWSTPRDIEKHAKQIRRKVDSCQHRENEKDESNE